MDIEKTKNKSKELDQFYTNTEVAEACMETLKNNYKLNQYLLLEPSAGTGAFSDLFHDNSLSFDIDPKKDYINKQDFLKINRGFLENENVFTIGNPPFGKNSSLAIKFFNKAAEFSQVIAFVVPKTFRKISVTNKLDLGFKLVLEEEIPVNGFIFENKEYSVPCVFQVWEKSNTLREAILPRKTTDHFDFTDRGDADFAIRRVGGLAGKLIKNFDKYKDSSHYFIKSKSDDNTLAKVINDMYGDLNNLAKNCAGNPSLSKHELINSLELVY